MHSQSCGSGEIVGIGSERVAGSGGDEVLDSSGGLAAGAGAEGGAVEGGGGAGEIELAGQGPAPQEAVDEAGVEKVSGAGGGDRVHAKSGGGVGIRPLPSPNNLFAQRRAREGGGTTVSERA